jgi:hypothetical protein
MDTEFVNLYIERIVKEVEELTKARLLNEAKTSYMEKANQKLIARIEELEKLIEKQNKKKTKEVDTSDF